MNWKKTSQLAVATNSSLRRHSRQVAVRTLCDVIKTPVCFDSWRGHRNTCLVRQPSKGSVVTVDEVIKTTLLVRKWEKSTTQKLMGRMLEERIIDDLISVNCCTDFTMFFYNLEVLGKTTAAMYYFSEYETVYLWHNLLSIHKDSICLPVSLKCA